MQEVRRKREWMLICLQSVVPDVEVRSVNLITRRRVRIYMLRVVSVRMRERAESRLTRLMEKVAKVGCIVI